MEIGGTAARMIFAIFTIAGILTAIFPDKAWYLEHGMWYKDSEPTDDALLFTRIGGAALTVLGIFMIIVISA